MAQPLPALVTEATSDDLNSRRHRAIRLASFAEPARVGAQEAEDRDAARTIALLAEALERIAARTTDAGARDLAEDALALFQGC
ncbi:MAG TPA: hypothetical protein VGI39_10600 [Polyangiaceae bacterium]|jgi:hypothetical protein